ncbi:MAG TPA: PH domain-containing protein [Allosphingosinicella sp.]|nr:PH domain-containing protein [Allosphingosinicella sp.]
MRILDVDQSPAADAARLTPHLVAGETVHAAFVAPTGVILFSDRRIILVQREHLLEARIETSSWPYRTVRHFSIQEGEATESRSTIRIWLGDEPQPLHLRANPGTDLQPLQRLLADRLV